MKNLFTLIAGIYFGIIMVKSEASSWYRIQKMFLFEEAHMYLILVSAIAVGVTSVFLIRRFRARTVTTDEEITLKAKPFHRGIIAGSIIFGMGWAITGACPGPIYAQIGAGEWVAVVTFISALGGMYVYAFFEPILPH